MCHGCTTHQVYLGATHEEPAVMDADSQPRVGSIYLPIKVLISLRGDVACELPSMRETEPEKMRNTGKGAAGLERNSRA